MTSYEKKRQEKIAYYQANYDKRVHCGYMGKAFELSNCAPNSRQTDAAGVGEIDNHNVVKIEGRKRACNAQSKHNGGRVDNIPEEFIIYALINLCNDSTGYVPRNTKPIVCTTADFIAFLFEINATKTMRHNGKIDGVGIQSSSKRLYLELEKRFPMWDKNHTYKMVDNHLVW